MSVCNVCIVKHVLVYYICMYLLIEELMFEFDDGTLIKMHNFKLFSLVSCTKLDVA